MTSPDADVSQRVSAERLHAQRITALERLTSDHATALTLGGET